MTDKRKPKAELADDLDADGRDDFDRLLDAQPAALNALEKAPADDERDRRRCAVEQAVAHNRIEGIETPPTALVIFNLWIAGEISSDECTRRIAQEAAELMRVMRSTPGAH
jgi:hypothetical protein